MSKPTDKKLYIKIKSKVIKLYPKHSAYRSGKIVQEYKKEFKRKFPTKSPYIGKKNKKQGLLRWFAEQWESDTGKKKYTSSYSVYRPKIRITKNTPKTFGEISKINIKKAKYRKHKYGRVKKF